jgi:hypothetical protein
MLRTKIVKEEKYFKISSDSLCASEQGASWVNKGKVYCDEPFIDENDCKKKFDLAMQEWEALDLYRRPEKPNVELYWKVVEEKVI